MPHIRNFLFSLHQSHEACQKEVREPDYECVYHFSQYTKNTYIIVEHEMVYFYQNSSDLKHRAIKGLISGLLFACAEIEKGKYPMMITLYKICCNNLSV